jgi:hypothetical protein
MCLVSEQIIELRWLVDELGHELDALATTSYPHVHCFLMRNLTTRIARVTVQVQGHHTEQPPGASLPSTVARLLEQSA